MLPDAQSRPIRSSSAETRSLEPRDLSVQRGGVREVAERRADPQPERLLERARRLARIRREHDAPVVGAARSGARRAGRPGASRSRGSGPRPHRDRARRGGARRSSGSCCAARGGSSSQTRSISSSIVTTRFAAPAQARQHERVPPSVERGRPPSVTSSGPRRRNAKLPATALVVACDVASADARVTARTSTASRSLQAHGPRPSNRTPSTGPEEREPDVTRISPDRARAHRRAARFNARPLNPSPSGIASPASRPIPTPSIWLSSDSPASPLGDPAARRGPARSRRPRGPRPRASTIDPDRASTLSRATARKRSGHARGRLVAAGVAERRGRARSAIRNADHGRACLARAVRSRLDVHRPVPRPATWMSGLWFGRNELRTHPDLGFFALQAQGSPGGPRGTRGHAVGSSSRARRADNPTMQRGERFRFVFIVGLVVALISAGIGLAGDAIDETRHRPANHHRRRRRR